MKTFAELHIICNGGVAETETKETELSTHDIYNEHDFNCIVNEIKEVNNIMERLRNVNDNACFTRKELSRYLSAYEFTYSGVRPTFKEPFTIHVNGEKITAYRYYYSKESLFKIFTNKKEGLKRRLFNCGSYELDDMISRAEREYERIKYKLDTLKNRKVQAVKVLNELNEMDL